jgi:hypothetical protein
VSRKPQRTHTHPVARTPEQAACRHQKLWAYRHSSIGVSDLSAVAKALGIGEAEVVATAVRLDAQGLPDRSLRLCHVKVVRGYAFCFTHRQLESLCR